MAGSFPCWRRSYVVSTDAIGMGLNLPIRRIIFMETEKFDGVERRELKPEEIKQIAGRAGRFGGTCRPGGWSAGGLPAHNHRRSCRSGG